MNSATHHHPPVILCLRCGARVESAAAEDRGEGYCQDCTDTLNDFVNRRERRRINPIFADRGHRTPKFMDGTRIDL
jgi:predicted amidophosphoribosyltransferase